MLCVHMLKWSDLGLLWEKLVRKMRNQHVRKLRNRQNSATEIIGRCNSATPEQTRPEQLLQVNFVRHIRTRSCELRCHGNIQFGSDLVSSIVLEILGLGAILEARMSWKYWVLRAFLRAQSHGNIQFRSVLVSSTVMDIFCSEAILETRMSWKYYVRKRSCELKCHGNSKFGSVLVSSKSRRYSVLERSCELKCHEHIQFGGVLLSSNVMGILYSEAILWAQM